MESEYHQNLAFLTKNSLISPRLSPKVDVFAGQRPLRWPNYRVFHIIHHTINTGYDIYSSRLELFSLFYCATCTPFTLYDRHIVGLHPHFTAYLYGSGLFVVHFV